MDSGAPHPHNVLSHPFHLSSGSVFFNRIGRKKDVAKLYILQYKWMNYKFGTDIYSVLSLKHEF